MTVTDVRVRVINDSVTKLKAIASITFDECFVIHDVKVIEGEKSTFIAMPSKKDGKDGEIRKDIAHPLTNEAREYIQKCVLDKYEEVKQKLQK